MTNFPSLPSPSTWASGDLVLAPEMRANVSNAVQFQEMIPSFMGGQQATSQSVANNAFTQVSIDAEILDEWNGHRQNSNGANYYAPVRGVWLLQSAIAYPTGLTGQVAAAVTSTTNGGNLSIGGQRFPARNLFNNQPYMAVLLDQTVITGWGTGDFIGPAAWQDTGGAVTLVNAATQFPWFSGRLVSQGTTSALAAPANATFPSPPTVLTHTFMNANVRDVISFLANPPVFQYFYTNSASIASQTALPAVGTHLGLNSSYVDNYSAFNPTTNIWTAPVAGVYLCYAQVNITANTGGQAMAAGLTITSANYNGGTAYTYWGGAMNVTVSVINVAVVKRRLRLNAGDTVSLAAFYRDSGAAAGTIGGAFPWPTIFFTVWENT